MSLRGAIEDFGLADILQLIAKSQRSGYIHLANDFDEIKVTVSEAWVTRVEDEGRPGDAKLGNRLVRAGLLTNAELGQALKRRADTGAPITKILVELGLATADTIRQYATLEATEALFDVFTWRSGTYEFQETSVPMDNERIEPISAEALIMQGIVLVDEWPLIKERVPHEKCRVVRKFELPPEPALDEMAMFGLGGDGVGAAETEVGANERVVHELCVPGAFVRAIVDRAPFHRFETYRCLSNLIGLLYVELAPPP